MNLKAIIANGLISPGTRIKPLIPNSPIEAIINAKGELEFDSQKFDNLDDAMAKVLSPELYAQSTSTGLQFWGIYHSKQDRWITLEHLHAKCLLESKPVTVRTSQSHPLRIDTINLPGNTGRIGMTFCPGKTTKGIYCGKWERNLEWDLAVIEESGAATLISVMEDHEFELLKVPDFKNSVKDRSFQWEQLQVKDTCVPSANVEAQWKLLRQKIHAQLKNNELIVIHCRGGLGRTGLLSAMILVEHGFSPVEAISMVRKTRSRTIETFNQEYYILTQAWNNNRITK